MLGGWEAGGSLLVMGLGIDWLPRGALNRNADTSNRSPSADVRPDPRDSRTAWMMGQARSKVPIRGVRGIGWHEESHRVILIGTGTSR